MQNFMRDHKIPQQYEKKIRILYIRTFLRYGIIGYLALLYFLAKNRTLKTESRIFEMEMHNCKCYTIKSPSEIELLKIEIRLLKLIVVNVGQ